MTTAREVRKLTRRILEDHPNFELVGRLLVMKPVHHVLRGVFVDRTRSADCFTPYCIVDYFLGAPSINLALGPRLFRKNGLWLLTSNEIEDDFRQTFETEVLPLLNTVSSLKALETHVLETNPLCAHLAHPSMWGVRMKMALGELEAAEQFAVKTIAKLMPWYEQHQPHDRDRLNTTKELLALLQRGDRKEMAEHLHAVERRHVEVQKLGHLHERTPFPLELL